MSAVEWISNNIEGTNTLTSEVCGLVSDFALMWSLFEASEIDDAGNFTDTIPVIARRLSLSPEVADSLLTFWRDRYLNDDTGHNRVDFLFNHHDSDHRESVVRVLQNVESSPEEKTICIIRIIYRLRNNLFHGNKSLMLLGRQTENLSHAVSSLQILLKESGRFVFLGGYD